MPLSHLLDDLCRPAKFALAPRWAQHLSQAYSARQERGGETHNSTAKHRRDPRTSGAAFRQLPQMGLSHCRTSPQPCSSSLRPSAPPWALGTLGQGLETQDQVPRGCKGLWPPWALPSVQVTMLAPWGSPQSPAASGRRTCTRSREPRLAFLTQCSL